MTATPDHHQEVNTVSLNADLLISSLPKFIKALYLMVKDEQNKDIICWAGKNPGFRIVDKTRFENELLPRHFHHKEFKSFHRQLNMYNFQKITLKDETYMEFYHPFFSQSKPELLEKVVRQTSKLFRTNFELRAQTMNIQRKSNDDDDLENAPYKRSKHDDLQQCQDDDQISKAASEPELTVSIPL